MDKENFSSLNSIPKKFPIGIRRQKNSTPTLPHNELFLLRELEEIKNNITFYNTILFSSPKYSLNESTGEIFMKLEFIDLFSIQIIFPEKYPFSPPKITFIQGERIDSVFDEEGKIRLDILKRGHWKPTIKLNIIINLIKNLVDSDKNFTNENIDSKVKYKKRRWKEYVSESKHLYHHENPIFFNDIDRNIKIKK